MDKLKNLLQADSPISEIGILNQWDAPELSFPAIPPLDCGYARARLTAFRSPDEWLTVFEIIGFDTEAGLPLNQVTAFGNKLKHHQRLFSEAINPPPGSVHFPYFEEDAHGTILIHPLDFTVEIRGQIHHFTPSPEDYTQLGIDLSARPAGEIDAMVKVLRWLTYTQPQLLFQLEAKMLERLGRPLRLQRFLQTYDWYHPDYREREKPSQSPCLRSLAKALAGNSVDMYKCPAELSNTHWSYWPEWPAG